MDWHYVIWCRQTVCMPLDLHGGCFFVLGWWGRCSAFFCLLYCFGDTDTRSHGFVSTWNILVKENCALLISRSVTFQSISMNNTYVYWSHCFILIANFFNQLRILFNSEALIINVFIGKCMHIKASSQIASLQFIYCNSNVEILPYQSLNS